MLGYRDVTPEAQWWTASTVAMARALATFPFVVDGRTPNHLI